MSKLKREQQKKRKREKARRERLKIQQKIRETGGEDAHYVYFDMEIYYEPKEVKRPLSPEMKNVASKANDFALEGNFKEALAMLEIINAKEPGRPSIMYNIAAFQQALGKRDLYDEIINKLIVDFPDYFFGQVAHATRLIAQNQLDEAWSILRPIYSWKRMHIAEFKAFAIAMILFCLAENNVDEAREIHQSAVEFCDGSFPRLDTILLELTHCRTYYSNRN